MVRLFDMYSSRLIGKRPQRHNFFWTVILIMAVLCLLSDLSIAQSKNYNVWLLNSGDLIDFNGGQAIVTDASNRNYEGNMVSLSDDEGRLVLYGYNNIYDSDNTVVCKLNSFYGCFGLRDPVESDSYYLFSSGFDDYNPQVYKHSRCIKHIYKDVHGRFVADIIMLLDGSGGMTGGVDGKIVFFVAYDDFDDNMSVFVVRDGKAECVQTIKPEIHISENFYTMRFNADFTRLYVKAVDGLYIFDFDFDSKMLGNLTFVSVKQLRSFDFSENGDYIYFLQGYEKDFAISRCLESDLLETSSIDTIATMTNKYGGNSAIHSDIQLAPDGNIYIGINRWNLLSYIAETDGDGIFYEDAIELNSPFGRRFPKMPRYQSSFKISKCSPTVAPEYRGYPYTSISWDFGDGTPIVNDEHPVHHYEKPGKYTVTMTVAFNNGVEKVVKKNVGVMSSTLPRIVIEDDF